MLYQYCWTNPGAGAEIGPMTFEEADAAASAAGGVVIEYRYEFSDSEMVADYRDDTTTTDDDDTEGEG